MSIIIIIIISYLGVVDDALAFAIPPGIMQFLKVTLLQHRQHCQTDSISTHSNTFHTAIHCRRGTRRKRKGQLPIFGCQETVKKSFYRRNICV